ncbi:MAG: hypothetical protein M1816_003704 [Peltula sp. TS41687]|nr:MAG: hypothetical protein M1816_003704 [Peltula sp. TS41687]
MTSSISSHIKAIANDGDHSSPVPNGYYDHADQDPLSPHSRKGTGVNVTHKKALVPNDDPSYEYRPEGKPYAIALKQYPATVHRQLYTPDANDTLLDPGTARANIAPTRERPEGTTERNWKEEHRNETVLVQHGAYFDRDHDGVIWPRETYLSLRDWGWSIPLTVFATVIIHIALSYGTCPGLLPDPFMRVWLVRIHKANHGSDSQAYDQEGRFRPQQFEEIFTKYDRDGKGGLNKDEIFDYLKGQRLVWDFFGWGATAFEWLCMYLLIWPEDGVLRKEDMRGVFDGSIFYTKAEEHKRRKLEDQRRKDRKRY